MGRKNTVRITRNRSSSKRVDVQDELPIMEVFKKFEQMTTENHREDHSSDQDVMPDTLRMTMDQTDGNAPIDIHCEAVKKDDGSVQYECRFVQEPTSQQRDVFNIHELMNSLSA